MDPRQKQYFDVAHPDQSRPSATSRPVIVGHRPQTADPMVNQRPAAPQPIDPSMVPSHEAPQPHQAPMPVAPQPHQPPAFHGAPASNHYQAAPPGYQHQPPANEVKEEESSKLHWLVWILLGLLGILIALYLLVDAGVIKGASHLPFHIFKQKTAVVITDTTTGDQSLATTPTTTTPSVPAGWKSYKNSKLGLSVYHPASWIEASISSCSGGTLVNLSPPKSEIPTDTTIMKSAAGTTATGYSVHLVRIGTKTSATCGSAADKNDFSTYTSLGSPNQLNDGVAKGNWLTFEALESGKTNADGMVMTSTSYESGNKIGEEAILIVGANKYQVTLAGIGGQNVATLNPVKFASTQLYKDSLAILETLQAL